jgi:hypothetical protein
MVGLDPTLCRACTSALHAPTTTDYNLSSRPGYNQKPVSLNGVRRIDGLIGAKTVGANAWFGVS